MGGLENKVTMQIAIEELKKELKSQLEGLNPNIEDIFNALQSSLGSQDQVEVESLESGGMTKEEIVKHFISGALDDQVVVQQIRNNLKLEIEKHLQAGTSTLDIFNKLKSALGLQDQTAIDAMVVQ